MPPSNAIPKEKLAARIAAGTFWTVAMRWGIRLISLFSVILLARILSPEDYGIVAKAVLIYGILDTLTDIGLENALIQNRTANALDYDTAYTMSILRGVLIALLLVGAAQVTADFFRQPELEMIIYVYACIAFVRGSVNVGIVDFRKNMQFNLDFRLNVTNKIVGFLVTIATAVYFRSYWAFIVGTVASTLALLAGSFSLSAYRPSLSLVRWRSLLNFGKWALASQFVTAINTRLDTLILARLSSTELLGLYTLGKQVSGMASTEIAMPVARAILPGLAHVNDDVDEFRRLYTSSFAMVLTVALPAALGVSALSGLITAVLLGQQWHAAGDIIFLLAFYGITRMVGALSTSAYIAFGRVDLLAKFQAVNLTISLLCLSGGYYLGEFSGMIWGILAAGAISVVVNLLVQHRIGQVSVWMLVVKSWRAISAAIVMWWGLTTYPITFAELSLLNLLCSVVIGGGLYVCVLAVLWFTTRPGSGPEQDIVNWAGTRFGWVRGG